MNDELVNIRLWGDLVGTMFWDKQNGYAVFEYDPGFERRGLEIAPLTMPLRQRSAIFSFPAHRDIRCFHGLPGLLADSLPDDFGNQLINEWFAQKGWPVDSITPADRLCYVGKRGMGALEFEPEQSAKSLNDSSELYIRELSAYAESLFAQRASFQEALRQKDKTMLDILRVGTSAGGAKPKAIIAYNEKTGQVRSGQVKAPDGFSYWLLKFDGGEYSEHGTLKGNPKGIGNIEYAYYNMAKACGIQMMESRLLTEGSQNHFMTKRFDRADSGEKIHVQTAAAIAHLNRDSRHSYEELFEIMRKLGCDYSEQTQLYLRMLFNVFARNHDDHTKNFSFMMSADGSWHLAPAYDMCFSYQPGGTWTGRHQLSLHGKQDDFSLQDLLSVAETVGIRNAGRLITLVRDTVARWQSFAEEAEVRKDHSDYIDRNLLYRTI